MDIKIAFIGNDTKYFDRVWKVFKETYGHFDLTKIQLNLKNAEAKDVFIQLYDKKADIIYIDFSEHFERAFSLSKFINKNNEMRKKATVALFDYTHGREGIKKALNAEMRLYHFKSYEINDVVYDPVSILDVNLAVDPEYFSCEEFQDITLMQPLRIGFVGNNHFRVETNSYLKVGEIMEVDTHPLIDIMPSRKVYITNYSSKDLYYNKRFAYDLEFIYIDNDFFAMTNKNWLLYKELKADPKKADHLDKFTRIEIAEDMKKRKQAFKPIRNKIDQWLNLHRDRIHAKSLKILIFDHSLDFMREIKGEIDDFPYSLNVQTNTTENFYQVERSLPHLIVYKIDQEVNRLETVKELVRKIKSMKDYQPFILVFQINEELNTFKQSLGYEKILFHKGPVHIDEIRSMAKKLDEKLNITKVFDKIFPKSLDEFSIMFAKFKVKVVKMSESIMYIKSKNEIPMWTLFLVQDPIPLVLTVVPHKEDSDLKNEDHLYRCLINGVGENEKAALRRLINKTIAKNQVD